MTDVNYSLTRADMYKLLCGEELQFNSDNDFLKTTFRIKECHKKRMTELLNNSEVNE